MRAMIAALGILLALTAGAAGQDEPQGAGGLVMDLPFDLALEGQDLLIAPEEIRIRYTFRHRGDEPATVGFSLPRGEDAIDPDGISVTLDGAALEPETLVGDGLWGGVIAPGATATVELRYRPAVEEAAFGEDEINAILIGAAPWQSDYCMDDRLAPRLARLLEAAKAEGRETLTARRVDYALSRDLDWAGVIDRLIVTMHPGENGTIFACVNGRGQASTQPLTIDRRGVVPSADIRFLILS